MGPAYDGFQIIDAGVNGSFRDLYVATGGALGGLGLAGMAKAGIISLGGAALLSTPAGWVILGGAAVAGGAGGTALSGLIYDAFSPECFPANTHITTPDGFQVPIQHIAQGIFVHSLVNNCFGARSTGEVTQIFRNITTEWLEVVWTHPETGAVEQIISTPGHRFLKPDGSYDRIIDMVDRSVVVADAANDHHDENDNSFGGAHPFSAATERPFLLSSCI